MIYPVHRRTRLLAPIDAFDGDLLVGDALFTLPRLAVARLDPA